MFGNQGFGPTNVIYHRLHPQDEHCFVEGIAIYPHSFQVCNSVSYYLKYHRL
jgi:hypothetical protein